MMEATESDLLSQYYEMQYMRNHGAPEIKRGKGQPSAGGAAQRGRALSQNGYGLTTTTTMAMTMMMLLMLFLLLLMLLLP